MSATRLGRLAGLVFVLAAALGGAGAASVDSAVVASGDGTAVQVGTLTVDWD